MWNLILCTMWTFSSTDVFLVLIGKGETIDVRFMFYKINAFIGRHSHTRDKCFHLTNKYFGIYSTNVSPYTSYFCGYYSKKNKNIWTYFWLYSNQCVSGWGKQKVQISFKNTLNIRLWYKKNGYEKKNLRNLSFVLDYTILMLKSCIWIKCFVFAFVYVVNFTHDLPTNTTSFMDTHPFPINSMINLLKWIKTKDM